MQDIEGTQVGSYVSQGVRNKENASKIISQKVSASQVSGSTDPDYQHFQENYQRFYEGYTPDQTGRFRAKAALMLQASHDRQQEKENQGTEPQKRLEQSRGFKKNMNEYFGESYHTTANNSLCPPQHLSQYS